MAKLRAVGPDDAPDGPRELSVEEAAANGSHLELLMAMRKRIAKTVATADCPPRDLAALTRRLQDIANEIEAIKLRSAEEAEEDAVSGDEDWDAEAL